MPLDYRRRTGIIYRRSSIGNMPPDPVLDGGRDAPISVRGGRLLWIIVGVSGVVGVALVALALFE